jgi:hypothetical protein
MSLYNDEIFGPLLSVRASAVRRQIDAPTGP